MTEDVTIEEVEYLNHGGKPYLARIFRPAGHGPFPAVIDAHGGAWTSGHRTNNDPINRAVAAHGIVVAALDFRNPPEATYPGSVADTNYGVRWLKREARNFASRPDLVGSMGTSSGGHLVVLNGLKPADPRYDAVPLAGGERIDARVPYVVTLWPVICPLGRYRDRKAREPAEQVYQDRGGAVQAQERYWLTEEAMGEGSPMLAVERGDAIETPHILYLQNPQDELHPRFLMERFVDGYKKRGGEVRLELFRGPKYDLVRSDPESAEAKRMIGIIARSIHAETGV